MTHDLYKVCHSKYNLVQVIIDKGRLIVTLLQVNENSGDKIREKIWRNISNNATEKDNEKLFEGLKEALMYEKGVYLS